MTTIRNGAFVPGITQNFATSGSSSHSNAVSATTGIVRVAVNQDTYVTVGTNNPTANVNCMLMPAGDVEWFACMESSSQIAFIQVSTAGIISITELG